MDPGTVDPPGTMDPGTMDPGTMAPWHHVPWHPGTVDPGTLAQWTLAPWHSGPCTVIPLNGAYRGHLRGACVWYTAWPGYTVPYRCWPVLRLPLSHAAKGPESVHQAGMPFVVNGPVHPPIGV